MSELALPVLTSKVDVMETFKRFGFVPTTDKERAERQTGHVDQCLCRFCQARKSWEQNQPVPILKRKQA